MKTTKITLIASTVFIIAACSSYKRSTVSTGSSASTTKTASSTPASVTTSTASVTTFPPAKPATGIYPPGNEELIAIQAQYKDVTLDKLKEGHVLYSQSACISCHEAFSIYQRGEAKWKDIIEDMAQRARLSDLQKDAVYKYVLAIKATQSK